MIEPEILMVTNAVMPDQLGGLQRYVRELAGAVASQGRRVLIVTKRASPDLPLDEEFDDGVRIHRYRIPSRANPGYALGYALASQWSTAGLDQTRSLVHVHYPLLGIAPALRGRRYVHTFHAPIYREIVPEHQDRYYLPTAARGAAVRAAYAAEALVARRARATIVLTDYMKGELAQLSQAAAARAVKIPAGLDSDFFSPRDVAITYAERGAPLLFTARRLVPRTGVTQLVEAMPAILARRPDTRLVIAGDGPLRGEIERRLQTLSLQRQVSLLGRVSDEELRDWYRAADLFVLPTQELEGFGMSTVEALACGTPAIGTPAGGTPEVLGSLDARLIAASRSAPDIAAAVLAVVEDAAVLGALASRARAHVVPSMSWSTIARAHLEIYERSSGG